MKKHYKPKLINITKLKSYLEIKHNKIKNDRPKPIVINSTALLKPKLVSKNPPRKKPTPLRAFLEPVKAILNAIGWSNEKKITFESFFS